MTTKTIVTSRIRQLIAAAFVVVAFYGQQNSFAWQNAVTIHGVEQQREGDNNYDSYWLNTLREQDINPLVYNSKTDMVTKILGRLGPNDCIGDLFLYGHGNRGVFDTGNGQSSDFAQCTYIDGNQADWEPALAPLRGRFCAGATVRLIGCNVGAGQEGANKLHALAQYLGVVVRAPVDLVTAGTTEIERWQEGRPGAGAQPPAPLEPNDRGKAKPKPR